MSQAETLTTQLHDRRLSVSDQVNSQVQALWKQIDPNELDAGWDQLSGQFAMAVYNGQLASATMTKPYIDQIDAIQGFQPLQATTDPRQYAGVAPDGRALTPLLYGAVTETKRITGTGVRAAMAWESGAAFMAAMVKTVLAEAGRQHDIVNMNARGYKRYLRTISPGACDRCAILAGIYSSAVAFPRHPNCQCVATPLADAGKLSMKRYESPYDYFESLSRAEQERIFTIAGSQAIRDGADIYQVVNARRGARGISFSGAIGNSTVPNSGRRLQPIQIGVRADGSPLLVYATSEGTTYRGNFSRLERGRTADDPSRHTIAVRLMPEQIYKMAGNNAARARELLIKYGYIF